jgi:hypothetical protein
MDIRTHLKADHEQALAVAQEMAETDDAQHARTLYKELKAALTAHSRAEEKVVYAALNRSKREDAVEMAHEGEVEHGLCDELLAQMARGKSDSQTWKAKATVVHELLEHHIEEEHDEMFKQLGELFSAAELAAMGERFEAAKDKVEA